MLPVLYGSLFLPQDEKNENKKAIESLLHNKLLWDPNPELRDINSKLWDKVWTAQNCEK